jgi:hypothetical protein
MKKVIIIAGITLFLVGLILLIIPFAMQEVKKLPIDKAEDSWELSRTLITRETYIVDIIASTQWQYDYSEFWNVFEDEPPSISMEIISPNGNKTELLGYFIAAPPSGLHLGTRPSLFKTKYVSVDSSSLIVDESYPQIRFSVKYDGTYIIRILHGENGSLIWTTGPPGKIIIYKEYVENRYSSLVPIGGVLGLSGIVAIAVGITRRKEGIKKRRLKKVSLQERRIKLHRLSC